MTMVFPFVAFLLQPTCDYKSRKLYFEQISTFIVVGKAVPAAAVLSGGRVVQGLNLADVIVRVGAAGALLDLGLSTIQFLREVPPFGRFEIAWQAWLVGLLVRDLLRVIRRPVPVRV